MDLRLIFCFCFNSELLCRLIKSTEFDNTLYGFFCLITGGGGRANHITNTVLNIPNPVDYSPKSGHKDESTLHLM